jgi:predicted RNA binding protein YcfA (HicA-like mRNA interferase family)
MALSRRELVAWLLAEGFTPRVGQTSHVQYSKAGVTITVPGHGPDAVSKKHTGMICRQLERLGYSRAELRRRWRVD